MKTKLALLLIGAGLVVSGYLVFQSNNPEAVVCSIGGGCETVLTSRYAKFLGMPVADFGLVWYLISLLLVWRIWIKKRWPVWFFRAWTTIGLVVSLYLLYLEKYVIHAYCTWCLVSLGLVGLLFILSFFTTREP